MQNPYRKAILANVGESRLRQDRLAKRQNGRLAATQPSVAELPIAPSREYMV